MTIKKPADHSKSRKGNRFENHPVATVTAIIFLALIFGLVSTESIFAIISPHRTYLIGQTPPVPPRYVRLREWLPSTVFEGPPPAIRRSNPGSRIDETYRLSIDEDGFIGPSRVHVTPDVKIVFLGGSTTECMYVGEARRFPYLVGRLLEARTGRRINSFNGGASGNNTFHSIHALNAKVLPIRPEIVVLMHNANDQGALASIGSYWPGDDYDWDDFRRHLIRPRQSIEFIFRSLRDMLIPRTYQAIKTLIKHRSTAPPMQESARTGDPSDNVPPPPQLETWGETFRRALTQFVKTAKIWRIQPVLMTQPLEIRDTRRPKNDDGGDYLAPAQLARGGFTPASFVSSQARFNGIVREVAVAEGALLIDLAQAIRWTRRELYDGLHFNDDGSVRAAAFISDRLEPLLRTSE